MMTTHLIRLNNFRKQVFTAKHILAFALGGALSESLFCLMLVIQEVVCLKSPLPLFREIWLSSFKGWWQFLIMPVTVFSSPPIPALVPFCLSFALWGMTVGFLFSLNDAWKNEDLPQSFRQRWLESLRSRFLTWHFVRYLFLIPILAIFFFCLIMSSADALNLKDHKTILLNFQRNNHDSC